MNTPTRGESAPPAQARLRTVEAQPVAPRVPPHGASPTGLCLETVRIAHEAGVLTVGRIAKALSTADRMRRRMRTTRGRAALACRA